MAAPTFNMYVLPRVDANVDGVTGVFDIRIARGDYDWNLPETSPTDVLYLDDKLRLIKGWSPLKKSFSDKDGDMTMDGRTLTLFDAWKYTGVDGAGTAYSDNLSGANQSLLWKILLSNPSISLYKIWWTFIPHIEADAYDAGTTYHSGDRVKFRGYPYKCRFETTGNDPDDADFWTPLWDIYFGGDIDLSQLQALPIGVHRPMTAGHLELNTFTLAVTAFPTRLKESTVADMHSAGWSTADMVTFPADTHTGLTTRPFYAGFAPATSIDGLDYDDMIYNAFPHAALVAGFGRHENYDDSKFDSGDSFPQRVWGIRPSRIIYRGADVAGFDFDEINDFTSAFAFFRQKWDNTDKTYRLKPLQDLATVPTQHDVLSDGYALQKIAICFNTFFGVLSSTYNGTAGPPAIIWPTYGNAITGSVPPSTTILELLKMFAYQFGCYVWFTLDNRTGRPRVRMLSRRTSGPIRDSSATNPRYWARQKGYPKREASIIAKDYVGVTNTAAEGEWRAPARTSSKDGIAIQIPFRTRSWGLTETPAPVSSEHTIWTGKSLLLNSKLDKLAQMDAARIYWQDNGLPSWEMGLYLYYIETNDTLEIVEASGEHRFAYPPAWDGKALWANGATGHWSGFYQLAACSENAAIPLNTVAATRCDTLTAPAQLMANELLGYKTVYTVKYNGVSSGDDHRISEVQLNMTDSWRPPGASSRQTFRAIDIEIDELSGVTTVKYVPLPTSYSNIIDFGGVLVNDQSTGSSSGSTGDSGTHLDRTTADYIQRSPVDASTNTITPQENVVGLTHQGIAGQTADFEQWKTSAGTTVSKIDANGNLTSQNISGLAFAGTTLTLTSKGTSAATVDGDTSTTLVTKGYMLSKIPTVPTDIVKTDPGVVTDNIVQPTANNVSNLILRMKSGQTALPLQVQDSSNTVILKVTANGGVFMQPLNNTDAALRIQATASGSTTELLQLADTAGNNLFRCVTGGTFYQNTGSGSNSWVCDNASSSASSIVVINVTNSGTTGRAQFKTVTNGQVVFGPLDNNSAQSGQFAISGGISLPIHTVTANTSLNGLYYFVYVDTGGGNVTITLPSAVTYKGAEFYIKKKVAANTVTVAPPGGSGQTIDGLGTKAWATQYTSFGFKSDGTNWLLF